MEQADPIDLELKALRKRLYTYHNQILEVERLTRVREAEYENYERNRMYKKARLMERKERRSLAFKEGSYTPLQNEYILEMMASYLPAQELRNCRLVCRLWNKEMWRALSARKTLIVTELDCPDAQTLLENARKSTTNVGVGNICFFDIPSSNQMFKNLMASFGWILSGLKLEECTISAKDLGQILAKTAPHLESFSYKDRANTEGQRMSTLTIIKSDVDSTFCLPHLKRLRWDQEFGRVELDEIVKCCPNLIELEYRNGALPITEKYKALRWDSLRSFTMSPRSELREEHILALTLLQLKLRRLTLHGVMPYWKKMNHFKKLLNTLSSTLEELELFLHYMVQDTYLSSHTSPFPVSLPQLKTLKVDFAILKHAKGLSFLSQLQDFECKVEGANDWERSLKSGKVKENDSVERLSLGNVLPTSLCQFVLAFKMCSNLDLFPEYLSDKAMRIIIKGFPQLQQFRIAKLCSAPTKLPLTDAGICGLSTSGLRRITNKMNTLRHKVEYPAIYDLKRLMRLEIYADQSCLTDISIIHGIAKCSKMMILGLPCCDLSDEGVEVISKTFKLTLLDIPHCPRVSESAITALRNSHKDMIFQTGILSFPSRPRPVS